MSKNILPLLVIPIFRVGFVFAHLESENDLRNRPQNSDPVLPGALKKFILVKGKGSLIPLKKRHRFLLGFKRHLPELFARLKIIKMRKGEGGNCIEQD